MLLSRKSYALTNSNNFWPSGKRLIQQLVLKLALIVFQNFRKWLDKIKLLLRVCLSIDLHFLLVKITSSRKLECKYFWNLLIGVVGMLC